MGFVSLCLMCLYTGSLPGLVIAPRYVAFVFCSKCFSIGQIAISAFSCSCCFFVRSIVDFFRLTISPSFLHLLMIVVMIFVSPAMDWAIRCRSSTNMSPAVLSVSVIPTVTAPSPVVWISFSMSLT